MQLNYYINQEIEPDVTEELMDYFRNEASSDSLEEAIREAYRISHGVQFENAYRRSDIGARALAARKDK